MHSSSVRESSANGMELAQMEIMATVARAKAICKQLIAKKAELKRRWEEAER